MPSKIRILIVEDNPSWADFLAKRYTYEVAAILGIDPQFIECENASTFDKASAKIEEAKQKPFDIVSLDINLGEQDQDGLHLLGEIAEGRSAWLVAILTGVETDATFTGDRAKIVRRNLRSSAMQTFPPERLVVIEKPAELANVSEAELPAALPQSAVLGNRIKQVVSIFEHSSSNRNVFRKLMLLNEYRVDVKESNEDASEEEQPAIGDATGKKKRKKTKWVQGGVAHWQIRFDCGEMITLPDPKSNDMEVIRVLLENPRKEFSYGALEAAALGATALSKEDLMAQIKPKPPSEFDGQTQAEQIAARMDGDGSEDSEIEGNDELTAVAREMLKATSATEKHDNFDNTEKETRDAYTVALKQIEAKILDLSNNHGSPSLLKTLKAEATVLQKEINKLRQGGRAPEGERVSQNKSRAIAELREQGLVDLANHLNDCIRAQNNMVFYWPPYDMNWQTE